jgi:quinol monooxygenase YgiN
MSTAISWLFEATVRPDGLDDYRALAKEIAAENEVSEPGQEIFEWFLDGHDVHIYERYSDADAAVAHIGRFVENFAGRFLDLCAPTRMSVYGDATEEVKAATAGFNPRFYGPIAGHARS